MRKKKSESESRQERIASLCSQGYSYVDIARKEKMPLADLVRELGLEEEYFRMADSEPKLETLHYDAICQVDPGSYDYCRERVMLRHFVPRIEALVGPKSVNNHSNRVNLGSYDAVRVAYAVIYSVLPKCRNCEHTWLGEAV